MSHKLSTLDAWKIISMLTITGIIMVTVEYYGIGFIVSSLIVFAWLYSLNIELSKTHKIKYKHVNIVSAIGIIASIAFVYLPIILYLLKVEYNALIILPFGIALLYCLYYLVNNISILLANLENGKEYKFKAAILIWAWPIGLWFLQPRIQSVLSNKKPNKSFQPDR